MEQKRVTFQVAKAIKNAGYPQDKSNNDQYYTKYGQLSNLYCWGVPYYDVDCFAPTYLDVWLWLWREKKIILHPAYYYMDSITPFWSAYMDSPDRHSLRHKDLGEYQDPEEVIIAAIEYLVDNFKI